MVAAMPGIDWAEALTPTVNLGEFFLRGSVVYLFLYAAFRVLRRQAGAVGVSDLLAQLRLHGLGDIGGSGSAP